ncbi:MAG: hypothetical protein H8E41_04295 [Desulfobulbaceae bacterium]|uniref:Uncharacterized protein n=1 Tax=Candidatus Desulfobia pelagia TaxID=2841692 RepID=A0A8J6ND51_9BACT|nr:hypothetical protein [Candidatus Desulfobia pelagia]
MTCKKAIGVANDMKDKYGSNLEIKIFTTDSEEAKGYNFRSSTNVLFNDELIPIDVATDRNKLDLFLSENI